MVLIFSVLKSRQSWIFRPGITALTFLGLRIQPNQKISSSLENEFRNQKTSVTHGNYKKN